MKTTIALFVMVLAVSCVFAGEGDTAVCKPFVERNETCRTEVLDTCTTVLKQKMLQQIEAAPDDFRGEMRKGLDEKVQGFCNGFISQVTGEQALGSCADRMGGSDPGTAAQLDSMKTCLTKETCDEYAACAMKFD